MMESINLATLREELENKQLMGFEMSDVTKQDAKPRPAKTAAVKVGKLTPVGKVRG